MKGKIPQQTDGVTVVYSNYANEINHHYPQEMHEKNLIDWYQWLGEAGHEPADKVANVMAMIESKDKENYVLALEIIRIKQQQWEMDIATKPKRQWALHTGTEGMKAIDFEIKREALLNLLKSVAKKFTKEQEENLIKMINSPDKENFVVAEEIIKTKVEWNSNSQQKTTSTKQ